MKKYQGHHKDHIILSQVTACPLPTLKNSSVDHRDQADQSKYFIFNQVIFCSPESTAYSYKNVWYGLCGGRGGVQFLAAEIFLKNLQGWTSLPGLHGLPKNTSLQPREYGIQLQECLIWPLWWPWWCNNLSCWNFPIKLRMVVLVSLVSTVLQKVNFCSPESTAYSYKNVWYGLCGGHGGVEILAAEFS